MFWHNKLGETTGCNRQGCAPPRLDGELTFKGNNQNPVVGSRENEGFYLGMSLIMFLNGLTWTLFRERPCFLLVGTGS